MIELSNLFINTCRPFVSSKIVDKINQYLISGGWGAQARKKHFPLFLYTTGKSWLQNS